jgi:hypothetical protein
LTGSRLKGNRSVPCGEGRDCSAGLPAADISNIFEI